MPTVNNMHLTPFALLSLLAVSSTLPTACGQQDESDTHEQTYCSSGEFLDHRHWLCLPCPQRTYMPALRHQYTDCIPCTVPKYQTGLRVIWNCTPHSDVVLGCGPLGEYYKRQISGKDPFNFDCHACDDCSRGGRYEARPCSEERDAVCCDLPGMKVMGDACVEDSFRPYQKSARSARSARSTRSTVRSGAGKTLLDPSSDFDGPRRMPDSARSSGAWRSVYIPIISIIFYPCLIVGLFVIIVMICPRFIKYFENCCAKLKSMQARRRR